MHRVVEISFLVLLLANLAYAEPPATKVPQAPSPASEPAPEQPAPKLPADFLVRLSFGPEASIYDLVQFLGPLKKVNFVLGDVEALQQAKITLVTSEPMPLDEAWDTFLSVLDESGWRLEPKGARTFSIVQKREGLPEMAPPLRTGD